MRREHELTQALRSALRDEYAVAGEYEMQEALDSILDAMSPAEAFNFGSALNRIAKDAGKVLADPTFASVAGAALPALGGVAGSMVGGPLGGAVGGRLGTLAAGALTGGRAAPRAAAGPPAPGPPVVPSVPLTAVPPGVVPPAAVAGGSHAAAKGLVLSQHQDVLQSLLSTALGAQGRKSVSGIPNAQVLSQLSRLFAEAAADADALMYLERGSADAEAIGEAESPDALYADLLGADNLELSEAAAWEGLY
ncbi:hypothetical protein ACWCQK_26375 [Streptomyces sp. NPDC002306]